MINRVILVGRLTKDPVLRKTQTGKSVARFTLAVNRRFKGSNQEQSADFVSCVAWDQRADFLGQYVKKGTLISIEGRIQTGSYDDPSGKRVYTTDVVCDNVDILESKASREGNQFNDLMDTPASNDYMDNSQEATFEDNFDSSSADSLDIASDDLPF